MDYRVFLELDYRRYFQNVKNMVSRLNRWGACGEAFNVVWELVLMSSCRLRHFVRMFLLFCLVAMMCQQTFLHCLNLDVIGETTSTSKGIIDLYTQKEPHSGKGPDMPSDAFGPGEVVVLYALVTAGGVPKQNLPVAFCVQIPDNTSFSRVAKTNVSGIARINFTIPEKCGVESEIFGEWGVLTNVLIGNIRFYDRLTFKVDWIIKLVSVRTVWMIDGNLTYRRYFGKGGDVGLEITLRSIAMSIKKATFSIVVQDELNVPINHLEIPNFEVQPNQKLIYLYGALNIPKWAFVGNATVFVSALTAPVNQSGVPYCPTISTNFCITIYEPLTITFHDVAVVSVTPSTYVVEAGQIIDITAAVRNEGTTNETFNVNAYYNSDPIETLQVVSPTPYSQAMLNFSWDTSSLSEGNYTITVSIPYLAGEADRTDNVFIDGIVEIKLKPPVIIHDIAVVDVHPSNYYVYIGDFINISVSVLNKETETESFNVTTYYDSCQIGTLTVINLAPSTQTTRIFIWNTNSVKEGFYQISASAFLSNDSDVSDNTFVDGVVQVKAKPPPLIIHDVAVLNVTPSSTLAYIGDVVDVYVVVKNEGNFTESFNVTVFYDSNVIETLLVENLEPNSEKSRVFHWNMHDVPEGNYTLSASASFVPDEQNFENNLFVDGVVRIMARPPLPPIHDVVVLSVSPSKTLVYVGEVVDVYVVVKNQGNYTETFNLAVYADLNTAVIGDEITVGTWIVRNLEPNDENSPVFHWNTRNMAEGNYTLSAEASVVPGELNIENNRFVDGIIEIKPKLPPIIHDIAIINVRIPRISLYIGELLHINVTVTNEGTETETFNVSAYYNSLSIETMQVTDLTPNTQISLVFVWNTSYVHEDFYQISSFAHPVPGEIDVADNKFIGDVVEVRAKSPPPMIHDVVVLSVSPSKTLVYVGEVVDVYVVVKNQGNYTETFNLAVYADLNTAVIGDEITVGTWIVRNLEPNDENSPVFHWNTRNMAEGNYTLSAEASVVPGELNIENNRFVDGVVWVKLVVLPIAWEIPRWLLALLFLLAVFIGACLVAAIVFALLWRRCRKKKDQMDKQTTRPEVGFKKSKTCNVCGKEFLGTYTFCPYCFTFHGKDYE